MQDPVQLDFRDLQSPMLAVPLRLSLTLWVCGAVLLLPLGNKGSAGGIIVMTFMIAAFLGIVGFLWGCRLNHTSKSFVGRAFKVRYLNSDEALTQRVHHFAEQLQLPPPSVGIMRAANAFAVGARPEDATVILGEPLLDQLDEDELDAVIGHELGHIATGDMRKMQMAVAFQRMFVGLVSYTAFIALRAGTKTSQGRYVGYLMAVLARHTTFLAAELMVKGLSRKREFYADAVGAVLTSPEAMIGALRKIHRMEDRAELPEKQFGALMFRGRGYGHWFATLRSAESRLGKRSLYPANYARCRDFLRAGHGTRPGCKTSSR